jgi:hypothetical protein
MLAAYSYYSGPRSVLRRDEKRHQEVSRAPREAGAPRGKQASECAGTRLQPMWLEAVTVIDGLRRNLIRPDLHNVPPVAAYFGWNG